MLLIHAVDSSEDDLDLHRRLRGRWQDVKTRIRRRLHGANDLDLLTELQTVLATEPWLTRQKYKKQAERIIWTVCMHLHNVKLDYVHVLALIVES